MKYIILLTLFLSSTILFSQEKFSREIGFMNENDLYISTVKDRYYTNGMFFSYRHLSKNKSNHLEKKIYEWQLGHEMFTPFRANVSNILEHDRPFASHLFGSFGIKRVYKNNQIFNTSIQIGVIGPNAFGRELQDFIHSIYGFEKALGWEYQIENAIGINLNATYVKHLVKDTTNKYDVSWYNSAKIGTVYSNIETGLYGRIGFKPLQKLANSIGFNTNLNNDNTSYIREIESFFYIKPMVRYALYDATLQGSFLNDNSIVTVDLVPLVFDVEVGFKFTANRFNFGYSVNYNSNKSENLRRNNGNAYGKILVSYLLP